METTKNNQPILEESEEDIDKRNEEMFSEAREMLKMICKFCERHIRMNRYDLGFSSRTAKCMDENGYLDEIDLSTDYLHIIECFLFNVWLRT